MSEFEEWDFANPPMMGESFTEYGQRIWKAACEKPDAIIMRLLSAIRNYEAITDLARNEAISAAETYLNADR